MFLFVFKALFTEFCNCARGKKIFMLIRICHTCVLSLETSSEINSKFIIFVKNVKCLPLTKTNRNKYLAIFDLSRFSIAVILLPNQVDLSD